MRLAGVIAMLAVSRLAAAQPAAGDRAAAEAEVRAKANDFAGAAAKYREAYAADPQPKYLCNTGIAYYKAKTELPRAQLYLTRCAERTTGDAALAANLRPVLGVVEAGLRAGDFTPVDVAVDPGTASVAIEAFGPDVAFVGPRTVWLPRGSHRITATADGYVARTTTVEAVGKDRVALRIVLDHTPAPAPIAPPQPVAPAPQPVAPVPPPAETRTVRHSMLPAIAATVGTGLFIAGALYARGRAQDGADRAPFSATHDAYEADKDQIETWNTRVAISGGLAVACAGAAGYLWYRALNSTTPTQRIDVAVTDRSASLTLSGRF